MLPPKHPVPRLIQPSNHDIQIVAGQLVEPEKQTAYIIRQGYVRVEVDVTTTRGIITFFLGTVEEGELLFEEELLATRDQSVCQLRYRAEIDVVLLPLTKSMLPRTVERWEALFLSFVRAIFRQRSKLYHLASVLSQRREELERTVQIPPQPQSNLDQENVRLRKELQSIKNAAAADKKKHADEVKMLQQKVYAAEQQAKEARKSHAEISTQLVKMHEEQVDQSNSTLEIVNRALGTFNHPAIDRMSLVNIINEVTKQPAPFRIPSHRTAGNNATIPSRRSGTLIPSNFGPAIPRDRKPLSLFIDDSDIPDDGPITKDWSKEPPTGR